MTDEYRVIGDPVFALTKTELLERDERTKTVSLKKLTDITEELSEIDVATDELYVRVIDIPRLLKELGFIVK